jgi:hypothetical protein
MSKPNPLNRREWLKAAGLTAAGAVLASRLADSGQPGVRVLREDGTGVPADPAIGGQAATGERRYILGFETYPPV